MATDDKKKEKQLDPAKGGRNSTENLGPRPVIKPRRNPSSKPPKKEEEKK